MRRGVGAAAVVACLAAIVANSPGGAQVPAERGDDVGPMSWSEFRRIPPVEPELRVRWGSETEQVGELHLPPGPGPHPVVALIHGGCWLSIADTGYMSHLARALTAAGWAVWAPEFRRVDMPGGSWPGIFTDVAAGVDHLRELAPEHGLDLERVVAMGHSSGGHLALWLAGRPGLEVGGEAGVLRDEAPLPFRGVVGLASIAGVADYHRLGGGGCGPDAVPTLLGGDPDEHPARLRLAEPGPRLARTSAGALGDFPVLLLTGELDEVVPLAHAHTFAAGVGRGVRVVSVAGAGHFEVVAPWSPSFTPLWGELETFLERVTRPHSDEGQR